MVGDAELAVAAASGDRNALADIYDRYANELYELCRVILRDPRVADDALRDTFVIAATRLRGLRDPARLEAWLFAVARDEAMRRTSGGARLRSAPTEALDLPATDDFESTDATESEALDLVWEAADALSDRERATLVLNIRQGLEGADLAAAAGLPGPAASEFLSNAKSQLDLAVRATVLIRIGRGDCKELAAITPRKHSAIDAPTRKRVSRHAATCATCAPKWNAAPQALEVLAAAPLVGAPVALRHKVLHDPRLIATSQLQGAGRWRDDGYPPQESSSRPRVLAALVAALLTVVIAAGLVLATDDEPVGRAAPGVGSTTTAVESDDEGFAPWPTDPKQETTTTTLRAAATTTVTTRKPAITTTTRRAAVTPTTAAPPPATTTTVPARTVTASARDNTLQCGTGTTTVVATTEGPEPRGLFLHWSASTEAGAKNLTKNGSSWSGTLGPFSNPGTVSWWVSTAAFGNGGTRSSTHTIDVIGC